MLQSIAQVCYMQPPIQKFKISGNIVDVATGIIHPGTIEAVGGTITGISRDTNHYDTYILPGFIDAHVHIESSMLTPYEFARIAVMHGTVASVSDPHEIANVLGMEGVRYMIEDAKRTPFKFCFGAPSCVPATPFESPGAVLGITETEDLLNDSDIGYLSEMMNFPGVISGDSEVMAKIGLAHKYGKPVDGHAPGLSGEALAKYVAAGITTDHECFTREEAEEKIALGMKIQIREGSAAKNFDALYGLIDRYPDHCMFCSDDKHPDDLVRGHINELAKSAVARGIDVMKVLRCACINPILHYGLNVGYLQRGHRADFIVVDNLADFTVLKTVIGGKMVAQNGRTLLAREQSTGPNRFFALLKKPVDFAVPAQKHDIRIIEVVEGQLVTRRAIDRPLVVKDSVVSDPSRDILKMVVVNRYEDRPPAIGFVRGFGLKKGAIASSVAHDSHNIIAVGVSDEAICDAVNLIIKYEGGICAISDEVQAILPLPVAGIISDDDGFAVAAKYADLSRAAGRLGTCLNAPYMTLSFMALLVIPSLKLSDKGLFDGDNFSFIDLFDQK